MAVEVITYGRLTWVNIVQPSPEDMQYLRAHYSFHPLELEDCLSQIERPKIDEHEDYLFIVMHFPVFDRQAQISRPSEVNFFIGANYLVTIHAGVLKPLVLLFNSCKEEETARQRHMGKGAGRLLYNVLDRMVDYCFPMLNKVGQHIRDIEEDMFTTDMRRVVQNISLVRRDLISLRRVIKPQIAIVTNLERKDRPFIQEELDVYFGDIVDGFSRAWDILEDYEEVIEGLSSTSDSLISYRINEVIRILTVISVIMLPLTLVSGIYGMNIALPLAQHPLSFVFVLGVMILVAGGMLTFFRHRGWV
ncbi:MAG: magnesium/cobalt transporter CorA [Anaerolineae bacterium]|nr:magnesium/cobalt transporter CorA [Anaerolineae bacterium]